MNLVDLPIEASLDLSYGYDFQWKGTKGDIGCEVDFKPYFIPSIDADGGAEVAKVIEAGVYAKGKVADTDVVISVFEEGFLPDTKIGAKGVANLKPFEYEIGSFYWYIECDFEDFNLFQLFETCHKGKEHKKVFYKGELIDPK